MKTHWPEVDFECVFQDVSGGNTKTLQGDFKPTGAFPIVDQGKELVAGFTDDADRLCKARLPVIVFGDHTRAFKYIDFPFCMGADGTKVLRPKVDADVKYLFYYLSSLDIPAEGYSRHFKFLKRFRVPLPPIEEQRRIADILDKAEALRAKRREAIARLDTLAQSIFIEMFGDPVANPQRLPKATLGDLIKLKSGDFLPSHAMERGDFAVYGGNGINGRHSKYMFEDPQIVIGRVGVYCGAVHLTEPRSWITDNALYVAQQADGLNRTYLLKMLDILDLNQYANQAAQPLLSGSRIYPVSVLVPPLASQEKFACLLHSVDELRTKFVSAGDCLDDLFISLQHRAFRGEL